IHPFCSNFLGPGTRVGLPEVADFPPYDDIDNCSRIHDYMYMHALDLADANRIDESKQVIRDADAWLRSCLEAYSYERSYVNAKLPLMGKQFVERHFPSNIATSILGKLSAK